MVLLAAALMLSACGGDRPASDEWKQRWDRLVTAIPDEVAVSQDDSGDLCREALAFLRSNRAGLVPTPDVAIDDTVTNWIEIAEDAFFECPPSNAQIGGFAEAYEELLRLQEEVEAVLEVETES